MNDPRGIAVAVSSVGKTYQHACERALALLALYYGGAEMVRLYAITNHRPPSRDPKDADTDRGCFSVYAMGLHRDGEMLRCDPNSSGHMDLPFDHPCIHNKSARDAVPGEPPTSTIGQNRGGYVAIQNGTGWQSVMVPEKDWFQISKDGKVFQHYRLPSYDPGKPDLILP